MTERKRRHRKHRRLNEKIGSPKHFSARSSEIAPDVFLSHFLWFKDVCSTRYLPINTKDWPLGECEERKTNGVISAVFFLRAFDGCTTTHRHARPLRPIATEASSTAPDISLFRSIKTILLSYEEVVKGNRLEIGDLTQSTEVVPSIVRRT